MKKTRKLIWEKYATREFSFLYMSYGLDCYIKDNLRKFDLVCGEKNTVTLYGIRKDTDKTYKRINSFVGHYDNKVLLKIKQLDSDINTLYYLVILIKKENNKNKIKIFLLKFDKLYFKMLRNYLFFVYMGYAGDRKEITHFINKHLKEVIKTRTYTIDIDMEKEFPNIYGKFDKKLGENCKFMSRKEILDYMSGKAVDFKKIDGRKNEYLLIMENGKIKEYFGSEINIRLKTELKHLSVRNKNKVVGKTACKGFAKGKARLVFTRNDYKKIQKNEILVTPMTKPDIELYLKLVKGIVTNDGGALCHASIISREMNIPCVVGTKIATDIFKDGDLVEVDADKGIVRKIDKSKK